MRGGTNCHSNICKSYRAKRKKKARNFGHFLKNHLQKCDCWQNCVLCHPVQLTMNYFLSFSTLYSFPPPYKKMFRPFENVANLVLLHLCSMIFQCRNCIKINIFNTMFKNGLSSFICRIDHQDWPTA